MRQGTMYNKTLHLSHVVDMIMEHWRGGQSGSPAFFYLFTVNSIVGLLTNAPLLFAFLRISRLQTARNVYVANLALGNMIMSAALMPCVYLPFVGNHWRYGVVGCKFFNSFTGTNIYCSTFSTIAIAADRYHSIRRTTPMRRRKELRIAIIFCLVIWLMAFACASPTIVDHKLAQPEIPLKMAQREFNTDITGLAPNQTTIQLKPICYSEKPATKGLRSFLTIFRVALLLPIPAVILLVYNSLLHRLLLRRCQRLRRLTNRNDRLLQITAPPHPNNGKKEAEHHRRITIMLFTTIAFAALLWTPYNVISIVHDHFPFLFEHRAHLLHDIDLGVQLFGYASLYVHPIIYGFLNGNYRTEIQQLCRRRYTRRNVRTPRGAAEYADMLTLRAPQLNVSPVASLISRDLRRGEQLRLAETPPIAMRAPRQYWQRKKSYSG